MAGPMNNPRDGYFYNPKRMHQIMTVSSLALLAGMIGWFKHDYDREWKGYQRTFQEIEVYRTHREIRTAEEVRKGRTIEDPATGEKIDYAKAQDRYQKAIADRRRTRDAMEKELVGIDRLQGDWYGKDQDYKFRKAELDTFVYHFQEARHHVEEIEERLREAPGEAGALQARREHYRADLAKWETRVQEWNRKLITAKAAADEAQDLLDAARKALHDRYSLAEETARRQINVLNKEVDELQRKVKEVSEGAEWRNAPIVDMLAPSIKIQQILLPHITDDYNFTEVWKVDRCTTCHITIANKEYRLGPDGRFANPDIRKYVEDHFPDPGEQEKITRVLAAHPKPEIIAFDGSPHPADRFGCTICHDGVGRSTDFILAAHTPKDPAQRETWVHRHGWREKEHEDHPMLPAQLLQSSCWKCHKQQVEIPGAEKWNRGKFLFERAGCYGCHKTAGYNVIAEGELEKAKVDLETAKAKGQPTGPLEAAVQGAEATFRRDGYRRPGPPLTHIADKTDAEWARKWVEDPKSFRPTTRMPTFFNLSNARGPVDLLRNDVEVDAIVDWLFASAQTRDYPEVVPGDAARGKAAFEAVGCMACHAVDGKGPVTKEQEASVYLREFAPDLGGVGSKMKPAWLVQWLRNPKHYFKNTRMPSLRLSEGEATDIAAYLMTLKAAEFEKIRRGKDVPDDVLTRYAARTADGPEKAAALGWKPSAEAQAKVAALDRDAKYAEALRGMQDELLFEMFRQKVSDRAAVEQAAALTPEQRRETLGRSLVGKYGCYGCHEIRGMETTPGIGVEFTGEIAIGSKDIAQLDFGFVSIEHSRESFIFHKLKEPRGYDWLKEKKPGDRLRMPQFGLKDEEAESLTLFLSSLVRRKIPAEMQRPMAERDAVLDRGRRIVRESNCRGCHVFDFAKIVFRAGASVKTPGGVKKLEADVAAVGQITVDGMNEDGDAYEFFFKLLESNPALGAKPGENVSVTDKNKDAVYAAIASRIPQDGGDIHAHLRALAKAAGIADTQVPTLLPPTLRGEGARVQSDWLYRFLQGPTPIRPALNREGTVTVRMPTFGFGDDEALSLARYFAAVSDAAFPFSDRTVQSSEYLAERKEAMATAEKILLDQTAAKCISCHVRGDVKPSGDPKDWGPDLMKVHDRLRPEWIPVWLEDPGLIAPGTPMPKIPWETFLNLWPGFQNNRDEVKRTMRDFLMNLPSVHHPAPATGGGN